MRGSWTAGGIAVLLTLLSVALAYRAPAAVEYDLGRAFPSALALENFHEQEPGYRWTRAASRIVFHDPGGFGNAAVALELSGFRPRGDEPPLVVVETGSESTRLRPSRRIAWYSMDTETSGWWSSNVALTIRSETFSPGAGDERALGVRVHRARLTVAGGSLPPLRQLLFSAMLVALAFRWWRHQRHGLAAACVLGVLIALAFALARGSATLVVPIAASGAAALTLVSWLLPALARFASELVGSSARALVDTASSLSRRRYGVLVAATVAAVWSAHRAVPVVEVDLGTGEASAIATRFGPLDRDGDTTFRRALAGATLDLRDFGGGDRWTVTVHAAAPGGRTGVLMGSASRDLVADVAPDWNAYTLDVPAGSFGWRPAPVLEFPGLGAGSELHIDRVVIDRGGGFPSLRALGLVVGATVLVAAALGSALAGGIFAGLVFAALVSAPVVTIPFLPMLAIGSVATAVIGGAARGFLDACARRSFLPALSPLAMSVALGGFVLSFATLASPLYVGGHYGFHTDIAQEISQGHFLHYYLPYPGSMLSRQPQWNHLIVPHSCLFHTVIAPFALLPRAWFHPATKLFLASLLFGITLSASLVATRVGSTRAGGYAALASVFVPTGFQLLGLGHLMTLFGTWAAAVALGFIVVQVDALGERSVTVWAGALVSLCCLSYTGSLLFASIVLVATCALVLRDRPELSRRLARVLAVGWGVSFLLYYVHWTIPFVRDSLPALLSGVGGSGGIDVVGRLVAQPGKLAYTFGSVLVPVVGLAGLVRARGERRVLLLSWGSILVGFSLLDVAFNFLLKHHYFTYPAVAVGLGLALAWLHEKSCVSRVIIILFAVSLVWMGLREAVAVAQGSI